MPPYQQNLAICTDTIICSPLNRRVVPRSRGLLAATLTLITVLAAGNANASQDGGQGFTVELGSRPALLVDAMDPGVLKDKLNSCQGSSFRRTDFSIGHRGAALKYPEHTRESYEAAARQGAGIIECDVTFTSDRELVCRHSQCDLHTTTNVLEIPELAAKCSEPFTPYDASTGTPAAARCCTSDFTLAEFRQLQGKMDDFNPRARTVVEYLRGTTDWRSDIHTSRGSLLTHAESIALFQEMGVKMTPELKRPSVTMPWQGSFTQRDFAQQMIDEYKQANVAPEDVWPQSFHVADLEYWIENEPHFARQAIYLDDRAYSDLLFIPRRADFERLKQLGVQIIAPPIFTLLELDGRGDIVSSEYANLAKAAGLGIIAWTLERSDLREGALDDEGNATFYYQSIGAAIEKESDMYTVLDVLAQDVEVQGIFSDWPATVTYYANCMGLQ
jgi:glycerophosphoryl diester phosphodiesterase